MYKIFDESTCSGECASLFGVELPSLFPLVGTLTEDKRGSESTAKLCVPKFVHCCAFWLRVRTCPTRPLLHARACATSSTTSST